ncbi:MAG: imidazoleglycerol-phosphate dehydratase [Firmicutes bacterium]|nr:imidazoleglycerol-phosphate dehydratase [Bacillota bacterium]
MDVKEPVCVTRTTRESRMVVRIDRNPRHPEAKKWVQTPLPFFNHMMEHVAWRGQMNIVMEVALDHFDLAHVITEDVGICFGKAVKEYLERGAARGIVGYGHAYGTIDEALTRAVISFENRAYLDFTRNDVQLPEQMEGMHAEDLVAFFEGFVQGAQCTLHLDLLKGRVGHGHHIWEATFRGFGMALFEALEEREWRRDMTAGVAGAISFDVS